MDTAGVLLQIGATKKLAAGMPQLDECHEKRKDHFFEASAGGTPQE